MNRNEPTTTDEDLMASVAQGDQSAWTELYDNHARGVWAFLNARCATTQDADDLVQAVWLKVWQEAAKFRGGHFRGWLFAVARNLLCDHQRRRRTPSAEYLDELPAHDDTASLLVEERLVQLRRCVEQLPEEQRRVVQLRLAGVPHQEVARQLEIAENTSVSRYNRAKQALKLCVEQTSA